MRHISHQLHKNSLSQRHLEVNLQSLALTRAFIADVQLATMSLIKSIIAALTPLAKDTTLCNGAISIILDQDRDGPYIIVGYTLSNGMHDGDERVYCDAIERRMIEVELLYAISRIITAKFGRKPDSLNNMSMVHSRHAAIIYWEGAVCVHRKSGPVLRLVD